jgi:hypothetical protein
LLLASQLIGFAGWTVDGAVAVMRELLAKTVAKLGQKAKGFRHNLESPRWADLFAVRARRACDADVCAFICAACRVACIALRVCVCNILRPDRHRLLYAG